MPAGMYMQAVAVLLKEKVTRDQVEAALKDYQILKRVDAEKGKTHFSRDTLILPYRPEVNGLVSVSLYPHPWPDTMGDPKNDPELFGAWSFGNYGPYTWPGSLERASIHSYSWEPGPVMAQKHQAVIVIGLSFAFGAPDDAPLFPADYRPDHALGHITKIAAVLLKMPQALCYFNPGGEILRDREGMREAIQFANQHSILPFQIWTNVRMFRFQGAGWAMMDTIGNAQLDLPDFEAYFPTDQWGPDVIAPELLNSNIYLTKKGDILKDGDTFQNSPQIIWQCKHNQEAFMDPTRPVISLRPIKSAKMPKELAKRFK